MIPSALLPESQVRVGDEIDLGTYWLRWTRGPSLRAQGAFYGWRMVILCAVVHAMTAPGQTIGISVFVNPMAATLGLTRTEIATAYLVGTLVSAATMPWVGSVIDRLGSRLAVAVGGGLLGLVSMASAGVNGLIALAVGFVALRLFGQGFLNLAASNAVAPWFNRRRGFALGVSTALGASLLSLIPIGTTTLIDSFGWRATWVMMGLTVCCVVLPIAYFGVVNRPEDVGQTQDGIMSVSDPHANVSRRFNLSHSREEALRDPTYWIIVFASGTASAVVTGLNFHQISILEGQGLSALEAAANYVPQTIGALAATLAVGLLVDRVNVRAVIGINMSLLFLVMLLLPYVTPGHSAILYGLGLGAASGANRMLEAGASPRLFGLAHLGAIRGVTRVVIVSASAVGPLAISVGRDITGTYAGVLLWMLVLPVAVACVAIVAPRSDDSSVFRREPDES